MILALWLFMLLEPEVNIYYRTMFVTNSVIVLGNRIKSAVYPLR